MIFFFCDIFLSFVSLGFTFIILISKGRKSLGVKALFDGFGSLRAVLSVVFSISSLDGLSFDSLFTGQLFLPFLSYLSFLLNFTPFMLTLNALSIISLFYYFALIMDGTNTW